MNSKSDLTWEKVQNLADDLVFKLTGRHLNDVEIKVLWGAYEGKTYNELAENLGFSVIYLSKDVGSPLWKKLSNALGEEVTKKNFQQALRRYQEKRSAFGGTTHNISANNTASIYKDWSIENLEFPGGRVPLNSRFYVKRYEIESLCYETIKQDGVLIRIKAPQEMGKTSLLERILSESERQNYQTVNLSLETDSTVFSDINKFLRYFCACVSKQLGMPNKLNEFWDDIFGCNDNATNYLEEYLLADLNNPLVLALDKVDLVFEQPEIATDFCRLIRAWHDLATRSGNRGAIWKKLRLIVVHSTEVYSSLDINYSPLQGVGRIIALEEFTPEQVQDLTKRYELDLVKTEIEQLMNLVGGHPHLVRLALDYLKRQQISLEELLQIASKESSPFRNHLRQHLWNLQQYRDLAAAFREVVTKNTPVKLRSNEAFKLQSMGLVKTQGDDWSPSYNLYRQYFAAQLVEL
ncbi:AAA-like domain-containing protein [Nostoc sp. LEGE 12447]|uniref:AAA-like domain-containing protein n=1 Tax=Nostoc sp. LEGE 12447 TaxID=1828640 RepID=UPI001883FF6C|nr:AAA-like domain-containing protein [Nostoc sp. LEGE 12447]MBE9001855.1 AAA-like domain-containing protein [Nostoc sp. LEGE 12447]